MLCPTVRKNLFAGTLIAAMMIFCMKEIHLLHIAMRKKEIPHEFRTRDGAHNWTYWRAALPEVLDFISKGFHQF